MKASNPAPVVALNAHDRRPGNWSASSFDNSSAWRVQLVDPVYHNGVGFLKLLFEDVSRLRTEPTSCLILQNANAVAGLEQHRVRSDFELPGVQVFERLNDRRDEGRCNSRPVRREDDRRGVRTTEVSRRDRPDRRSRQQKHARPGLPPPPNPGRGAFSCPPGHCAWSFVTTPIRFPFASGNDARSRAIVVVLPRLEIRRPSRNRHGHECRPM